MRVGATRPQLTFLPTPQLNCALHQKQIRVDESTTNGKAENILLLDVTSIYLLPSVNSVHYDIDFSKKTLSISIASGFTIIYRIDNSPKKIRGGYVDCGAKVSLPTRRLLQTWAFFSLIFAK